MAQAHLNRGFCYALTRDYDQAIADFTETVRLKPDSAQAYFNRGIAYREKGDSERAKADFAAADQRKLNEAK